jgi:hypothetical protein
VGNKIKTKQKKWWRVNFTYGIYSVGKFIGKLWTLFIISITKGITDGIFHRYFPESSRIIHFPIALLIVVLYGQNHRRIEKSSVLFGGFFKKKSINLKFSFKYYRQNHRRIEKSSVIVGGFWKLFMKLKI